MQVQVTDAQIEELARDMALLSGNGPDVRFFRGELLRVASPFGAGFSIPPEDQVAPLWHMFVPFAVLALGRAGELASITFEKVSKKAGE